MKTVAFVSAKAEPIGKCAKMGAWLESTYPIFTDMPWRPANEGTHHVWQYRSGVTFPEGAVVASAMIPIAKIRGRSTEEVGESFLTQLFYGNSAVRHEEFCGFASLYNTWDPNAARSAVNVIDGGPGGSRGKGSSYSIYLVMWGRGICVRYCGQSYSGGLLAETRLEPPLYGIDAALCVEDWRCCVRIANIDWQATRGDVQGLIDRGSRRLLTTSEFGNTRLYVGAMGFDILDRPADIKGIPVRVIDCLRHDEVWVD